MLYLFSSELADALMKKLHAQIFYNVWRFFYITSVMLRKVFSAKVFRRNNDLEENFR